MWRKDMRRRLTKARLKILEDMTEALRRSTWYGFHRPMA